MTKKLISILLVFFSLNGMQQSSSLRHCKDDVEASASPETDLASSQEFEGKLYKFFNITKELTSNINNLPAELQKVIITKYLKRIKPNGWWYNDYSINTLNNYFKKVMYNKQKNLKLAFHFNKLFLLDINDNPIAKLKDSKEELDINSAMFNDNNYILTVSFSSIQVWDENGNKLLNFNLGKEIKSATIKDDHIVIAYLNKKPTDIFDKDYKYYLIKLDFSGNVIDELEFDNVSSLALSENNILIIHYNNWNKLIICDYNGTILTNINLKHKAFSATETFDGNILTKEFDALRLYDKNGIILHTFNFSKKFIFISTFLQKDLVIVYECFPSSKIKIWNINGELVATIKQNPETRKTKIKTTKNAKVKKYLQIYNKRKFNQTFKDYEKIYVFLKQNKDPEFNQILLLNLINLYLESYYLDLSKRIKTPEDFLNFLSIDFELNFDELINIWNSLDLKIQQDLWQNIYKFISLFKLFHLYVNLEKNLYKIENKEMLFNTMTKKFNLNLNKLTNTWNSFDEPLQQRLWDIIVSKKNSKSHCIMQ